MDHQDGRVAHHRPMAEIIRAHDWSGSPLGPMADWCVVLRTVTDMVLGALQPMYLNWGPDHILIYNDAYVPILGAKHPAALGRPFLEVWSEVRDRLTPLIDDVFSGNAVHMDDLPLLVDRGAERELVNFAFSYTPVRAPDGAVAGLFCACTETTGVVAAERRRTFLLALSDTLRDLDTAPSILSATVRALRIHLDARSVVYATIASDGDTLRAEAAEGDDAAFAARLADLDRPTLARLRAGESVVAGELSNMIGSAPPSSILTPLLRDGSLAALLVVVPGARRLGADDLVLLSEVAFRAHDAAERALAQHALRDSEAYVRLLLDSTAEGFYAVDRDGATTLCNPAFLQMLGFAQESDAIGRKLHGVIHHSHSDGSPYCVDDCPIYLCARHGKAVHVTGELFYRLDGSALPVEYWARPIMRDGLHVGAICNFLDVTERLQAEGALRELNETLEQRIAVALAERAQVEEALRQSQKMEAVGQLTGGLAHDFNNLLTGITGSLELLGARIGQGRISDLDRYVNAAQGAARRAASLTHRLLAFSRRQTLEPRPTDVNRLVGGMEELIRRTVGPSVAIEVVGAAGLWPALVDPNQLENALLNLCINARDAMPDGGRLTIETANTLLDHRAAGERELPPGQYLSLSVSDTGTGMSPEVAARAFDPFFTTKPIGLGTGLGLSMIYGFARQSGGQVRIYSELGHGTTMRLYLPRHLGAADPEPDGALARAPDLPGAGPGETVLVVDDEATIRMLVVEILGDLGYAAIEAMDGAAGLEVLRSDRRIDLLITDVGLPGGMNGRQVADAGRALRPELKVLFITGYAENAVLGHGHLDPGMQVLTKPFAMDALAARIRTLISTG